jgi:hypothetical protein
LTEHNPRTKLETAPAASLAMVIIKMKVVSLPWCSLCRTSAAVNALAGRLRDTRAHPDIEVCSDRASALYVEINDALPSFSGTRRASAHSQAHCKGKKIALKQNKKKHVIVELR